MQVVVPATAANTASRITWKNTATGTILTKVGGKCTDIVTNAAAVTSTCSVSMTTPQSVTVEIVPIFTLTVNKTGSIGSINPGSLRTIQITDGGAGYVTAPTVTIPAPVGVGLIGATATANISGSVTALTITNPGTGYAAPPAAPPVVTITAPPARWHSSHSHSYYKCVRGSYCT